MKLKKKIVETFSLASIVKILICDNNLNGHLKKAAKNLRTPPLVSPQNDVWKWLQKFHTGDVVCHYPDLSSASDCNFPSANDQSETLPRSGYWHLISMKFLQSFLRRHFTGKPVVVVKNVGCFLTVVQFSWCKVAMQLGVAMWAGTGLDVDPSSCSFPKARLYGEKLSWVEGTFHYKMWWTVYVKDKKLASLEGWPAQREGGWPHCSTIMILYTPKKCNNARAKYKRRRVTKIYPNSPTRTHMYELVTKLGLRRTDNRFYYTLYSLSVARGARGGREEGSLPPRAPRPSLPFQTPATQATLFPDNACCR